MSERPNITQPVNWRAAFGPQARFGGHLFQSVGGGDDMSEEHWAAFCVLLAAVSVPSVSLLFAGAWELWSYSTKGKIND